MKLKKCKPSKREKQQSAIASFIAKIIQAQSNYHSEISCSSCAKSFCCSGQKRIDVLYSEFEFLKKYITKEVRKRAFTQIERFENTGVFTCPFLNEKGLCSVYSVRPFSCASHFVITPIECCDTSEDKEIGYLNKEEIFLKALHSPESQIKEALTRDGKFAMREENMIIFFSNYIKK